MLKDLEKEKKEWQFRETSVINRESAIEETKQEYSKQRAELAELKELPTLRTKVETLEGDQSILKTDNEVLRKEGKEKSGQIKRLETEIEDLKNQVGLLAPLKIENKMLKETPMIPCRGKGSVPLTHCMKECEKFKDQSCESYAAIWRLSTIPIQGVETEATKP